MNVRAGEEPPGGRVGAADDAGERWYSFADAAFACGVSRDTVKRRHRAGFFPGAVRGDGSGPGGPWLVPEADLLACGLLRPGSPPGRAGEREAEGGAELAARLAAAEATVAAQARHLHDLRTILGAGGDTGRIPLTG